MSDELFLEGKNYMSSKRAAVASGYAQDYIGQLARGGLIDAQRVGGLWYVSLDSLNAYQKNAEEYKPVVPAPKQASDIDAIVSFDGRDYISASRAAKLTGYNQDYIGQLARGGKILSRQVGNRWYIEREGLQAHKTQKDSMLAAVQSEAVGLTIKKTNEFHDQIHATPLFTYNSGTGDMLPRLEKKRNIVEEEIRTEYNIPIRVVRAVPPAPTPMPVRVPQRAQSYVAPAVRKADIAMSRAIGAGLALTFVIVLSYGFVTLKQKSLYTFNVQKGASAVTNNAFVAGAAAAAGKIGDILENIVAPEQKYIRTQQ